MAWDKGGRYYTRSRKVNGRVVREYIGAGRVAELVAQMDALERERRQQEALELREQKDELSALDADIKSMSDWIDLVARAALLATGHRQHKRGEWRRRRDNRERALQAHIDRRG
jgi:hypothetical protein